jgi:Domain of unknown function (DUF4190)
MSGPGGFGEGAHGNETNPPQAGGRDDWTPPWDPPAVEYPAYSPPGYPPEYPPPAYGPPPGYGGFGGPPYPPQYGAPPPGYGPPPYSAPYPAGYPGYGPPPHAGPYPGGYYAMPDYRVKAGTNGLAIASLISSFTGFFCCAIGSIVAIVLGVIAMNQIKETRQEGYGLAVTGIVIGVGTMVVFLIIAIFSIRSH